MAQNILGVEIFSAGTFRPSGAAAGKKVTISEGDLDLMIESFNELVPIGGFTPVLKLGHADAQRFIGQSEGAPNLGIVDKIRKVGSKILADFVNVPDAVVDLIKARRFNNVSIEMVPSMEFDGRKFSNVLTAVALLGAELPAVKGLADLASTLFTEAEIKPVEADEIVAYEWETEQMPDTRLSQEQHEALVEAAVTKATAEAEAKFKDEREQLIAERDAARQEVKDGAAKFSEYRAEVGRKAAEGLVDGAIKAGKLLPKQKDAAMAFALNLSGTVKFGEAGEEKSMADLFSEFLDGMPTKVDFNEHGASDPDSGDRGEGGDAQATVCKRVDELRSKDSKLSYSDALSQVLNADEKLKLAYFNIGE